MLIGSIAVVQAGKWLLTQAGLAIYEFMKQRLLENMGMSAKQLTLPDEKALLDTYFEQFQETLAQKIIDRFDEDRLVKLNSAISLLREASRTRKPSLKQGFLLNAASKFFDIASLPDPGTTAGIPNAQLRSLAHLGIAAIYIGMDDEKAAKNLAVGILEDIPTAKKWFGDSRVQEFLEQSPDLLSSVSALQLPAPHSLQPTIMDENLVAYKLATESYRIIQGVFNKETNKIGGTTPVIKEVYNFPSARLLLQAEKLRVRSTLYGHEWLVTDVAISPDGQTLVSGSWDKTIKIWNLATGKEVRTLTGHTGEVEFVAISPDGQKVISWSYTDYTIKVWNLSSGQEVCTFTGHNSGIWCLTISPDKQTLIIKAEGSSIKVWNLSSGQEVRTFSGHGHINRLAISSNRQTLVSSAEGMITVWNLSTWREVRTFTGHRNNIWPVAISPDGQTLVGEVPNYKIRVWNLNSGQEVRTFPTGHTHYIQSLAISPDGQTLVSGSADHTIKIWNLNSGKEVRTLTGHTGSVNSVAISPDGQTLVSGSADKTIKVWGT